MFIVKRLQSQITLKYSEQLNKWPKKGSEDRLRFPLLDGDSPSVSFNKLHY
jgi:hypothetical protein